MYNQLIALVTKYQTAIAKLEALNVADTAEILTMIAQRRTAETRYNVLRINRAERNGTIFAYKRAIEDIANMALEIES